MIFTFMHLRAVKGVALLFLSLIALSFTMGASAQTTVKKSAQTSKKIKEIQINGQIFIVTKESLNVKLALVTVAAYPESELQRQLGSIEERDRDTRRQIVVASSNATSAFNEVDPKYQTAKHGYEYAYKETTESVRGREGSAEWAMFMTARKMYKEYKEKFDAIRPEWDAKQQAMLLATAAEKEILSPAHYIQGLHNQVAASKSDVDGNFDIKVPTGSYVLTAIGKRIVGEKEEIYEWLVKVDTSKGLPIQKVMLSNDNLYATNCVDCVHLPTMQ